MHTVLEIISENFVPAIIAFCVLAAMVLKSVTLMVSSIAGERTRREIAAYIAEGSLTPEQGEKLLKADVGRSSRCT